jgi:hypothetical protein
VALEQKILDELYEHKALLATLEERTERYNDRLTTYNEQLAIHIRRSDALETKVEELYKWKFRVMGALIVGSAFATFLLNILSDYVSKHL